MGEYDLLQTLLRHRNEIRSGRVGDLEKHILSLERVDLNDSDLRALKLLLKDSPSEDRLCYVIFRRHLETVYNTPAERISRGCYLLRKYSQ